MVDLTSHSDLEFQRHKTLALLTTAPTLAVDTETNGKDIRDGRGFCIGISIAGRTNEGIIASYFPVAHTRDNIDKDLKILLYALIRSRERIVFHNRKFDIPSLRTRGLELSQETRQYCTMIMAHMLNENVPKGLDWLAKNELKKEGKLKDELWETMFKIYGWSADFPSTVMHRYATGDAVDTLELFEKLHPLFLKAGFDAPT